MKKLFTIIFILVMSASLSAQWGGVWRKWIYFDSDTVYVDGFGYPVKVEDIVFNGRNITSLAGEYPEGWCTHEAATDTVTLGTLPANAIVLDVYVWVQEAFNSDAADNLIIGYTADDNAYATTVDVSTTGVKAVTLGTTSRTVDATSRTVVAYYDDAGSDATTGEVHVVVEWMQATVNP